MAERLARIYGTQMDKVNCPFYIKMGACRYGDSCQRIHNKPPISQTVMLVHMYENSPIETALTMGNTVGKNDAETALNKFQEFFEDVFKEMYKYGQIEEMIVVDNLGDHIVGNVYVRYTNEDYAENAIMNINGRYFNGKKIDAQYSSVTDFGNAKCKQYLDGSCKRGGFCNYMHIKPCSKTMKKELMEQMHLEHPEYKVKREQEAREKREREMREDEESEESGRSRSRNREREREKEKKREKSKEKEKEKQKKEQKEKKEKERSKERSKEKSKEKKEKKKKDRSRSKDKSNRSRSRSKKQKKEKKQKRRRESEDQKGQKEERRRSEDGERPKKDQQPAKKSAEQ